MVANIPYVDIGLCVQQHLDNFPVTLLYCTNQSCIAIIVLYVDIGLCVQLHLDIFHIPSYCSIMQCCLTIVCGCIHATQSYNHLEVLS